MLHACLDAGEGTLLPFPPKPNYTVLPIEATRSATFPEAAWMVKLMGKCPRSPVCKSVQCVRETEILVEPKPLQGVSVCDHAGRVINKFSRPRST